MVKSTRCSKPAQRSVCGLAPVRQSFPNPQIRDLRKHHKLSSYFQVLPPPNTLCIICLVISKLDGIPERLRWTRYGAITSAPPARMATLGTASCRGLLYIGTVQSVLFSEPACQFEDCSDKLVGRFATSGASWFAVKSRVGALIRGIT